MKQLILAVTVVSLSSICALVLAVAIASLLDHTGHAMSWFSSTFLLYGLYVTPTCCIILSTCVLAKKHFYEVSPHCRHLYFNDVLLLGPIVPTPIKLEQVQI